MDIWTSEVMKTKKDDILENKRKYSQSATEIDEAIDDLTEHGPPKHAWDQVAPGAAEQQALGCKCIPFSAGANNSPPPEV